MAWIHDSGYLPAYRHSGYVASVLTDGTDTGATSAAIEPLVTGWRAACECGWRDHQIYPRAEWPSRSGAPPELVDGWESGGGAYAEWDAHLTTVLPELAVHDLYRRQAAVAERLDDAVQSARHAGLSWARIAAVTGMSAARAEQRWGHAVDPTPRLRSGRPPERGGPAPSR